MSIVLDMYGVYLLINKYEYEVYIFADHLLWIMSIVIVTFFSVMRSQVLMLDYSVFEDYLHFGIAVRRSDENIGLFLMNQ